MIHHEDVAGKKSADAEKDHRSEEGEAWCFYDLDVINAIDPELGAYLNSYAPQADLYAAFDEFSGRPAGTTFNASLERSRGCVLVDPLMLPSPELLDDWPLTNAGLFLPLAVNAQLKSAVVVCPLPLVAPSKLYLEMFASVLAGYTLNFVYCTPYLFKRYQTKLKGQGFLRESFQSFDQLDSVAILPGRRQIPLLTLENFRMSGELSEKLSPKTRQEYEVLPLYLYQNLYLTIAITEERPRPDQLSQVTQELGGRIKARFVQIAREQLDLALKSSAVMEVTSLTQRLAKRAEGYALSGSQSINLIDTAQVQERLTSEDATVIDLVNAILTHADKTQSTDIHLVPFRSTVRVTFRTDTLLHDFPDPIPKAICHAITNRIKLMSTIDIQPTSKAQHG